MSVDSLTMTLCQGLNSGALCSRVEDKLLLNKPGKFEYAKDLVSSFLTGVDALSAQAYGNTVSYYNGEPHPSLFIKEEDSPFCGSIGWNAEKKLIKKYKVNLPEYKTPALIVAWYLGMFLMFPFSLYRIGQGLGKIIKQDITAHMKNKG